MSIVSQIQLFMIFLDRKIGLQKLCRYLHSFRLKGWYHATIFHLGSSMAPKGLMLYALRRVLLAKQAYGFGCKSYSQRLQINWYQRFCRSDVQLLPLIEKVFLEVASRISSRVALKISAEVPPESST